MSEVKMSETKGYKFLLKNQVYLKMLIGTTISRLGDAVDTVAYGYMVYQMTGSAILLAVLFAVNGIPSVLISLISGVVVGYVKKKTVIWICDFGRGLVVVLTGVLYYFGLLEVWHLYVFTVLNSSFEAFRQPAATSFFANEVPVEAYEHGTSLSSSMTTFAQLIGYGMAGVLIGVIGVSGAIAFDGITFLICGLLMITIRSTEVLQKTAALTVASYIADLSDGFRYVQKNTTVLSWVLLVGSLSFFLVPFNALQAAYVTDVLQRGPNMLAIMGVAFLAPMILGSLVFPVIKKRIQSLTLFISGGIGLALGYGGLGLLQYLDGNKFVEPLFAFICIEMGFALPFITVPAQVAFMKCVDKAYMPRVAAMMNMIQLASSPIGGAVVGALLMVINIPWIFYVSSGALIIIFLLQLKNKAMDILKETSVKEVQVEQLSA